MSSSDEDSSALQFRRSVSMRKHRARVLTAGSDEENTPPLAVGQLQGRVNQHVKSFSARFCSITQVHEAAEGVGRTSNPSTPQPAAALDIDDPFTPWLRTARKTPHKLGSNSNSSSMQQDAEPPSGLTLSSSSSLCSWQQGVSMGHISAASTHAALDGQSWPYTPAAASSRVSAAAFNNSSAAATAGPPLAVKLFSTASPAALKHDSLGVLAVRDAEVAILQQGWHTSSHSSEPQLSAGGMADQQYLVRSSMLTRCVPAVLSSSLVGNRVDSHQQRIDVEDALPSIYHTHERGSGSAQRSSIGAVAAGSQRSSNSSRRERSLPRVQQQTPSDSRLQHLTQTSAAPQAAAQIAALQAGSGVPTDEGSKRSSGDGGLQDTTALNYQPASPQCPSWELGNSADALPVPALPRSEVEQLLLNKCPEAALSCGATQPAALAAPAACTKSSSDDEDYHQISFSRRKPRRRALSTNMLLQPAFDGASRAAGGSSVDTAQVQPGPPIMLRLEGRVASCSSQDPGPPSNQCDTGSISRIIRSSSDDDQDLQLTLSCRKPQRLADQPWPCSEQANQSISSSSGADKGGDSADWAASSNNIAESGSGNFSCSAPDGRNMSRGGGNTATPQLTGGILSDEQSGRITPGSSSSLVARRRKRHEGIHSTSGFTVKPQQQQQQQLGCWWQRSGGKNQVKSPSSITSAAADPYDLNALMTALTPLNTVDQCVITPLGTKDNSACVTTPCAMLPFTPAAAPAARWTSAHPGDRAAAATAAADSKRHPHTFRLSPISPPVLKPRITVVSTPTAATAAGGGASSCMPPAGSAGAAGLLEVQGRHVPQAAAAVAAGPRPAAGIAAGSGQGAPAAGRGRKQQQAGSMTAPAKAPSSRMFARQRQQMAQQLYDQWNEQVFDGGLPPHLPLVWNPRLTSTAGQVVDDGSHNRHKASREERIPVRLELSTKVLDTEARLRTTLGHEMCHVAAWTISREFKQHHGPAFWSWASRFEERVPGVKITTCHNYEIHAPFRWQCTNSECGKQYHRHKRSIDPNKHVCSRCSGRLTFLGKFSRTGQLLSGAAGSATPATSIKTPGGNVFSQFVKIHFANIKKELPAGTPHKEIMSRLASQYKQQKVATANLQQKQQALAVNDQQQEPAAAATKAIGNAKEEQVVSIYSLSDSDLDSNGQRDVEVAREQGDLLTFMQRLDLAG